jgi:hypothetical protein
MYNPSPGSGFFPTRIRIQGCKKVLDSGSGTLFFYTMRLVPRFVKLCIRLPCVLLTPTVFYGEVRGKRPYPILVQVSVHTAQVTNM